MSATTFIELVHKGQTRKTGDPFVTHLYAVRDLLAAAGVTDTDILDAALLHDSLEDGNITKDYLALRFGHAIADIVATLSKERLWNTEYWKVRSNLDALEESWARYPEATMIKIADRLHNVSTICGFPLPKQREYLRETTGDLIPLFRRILEKGRAGAFAPAIATLLERLELEVKKAENSLH